MTPKIIFYVSGQEAWAPPSILRGGIGGSETAVVHIARLFHQAGWHVEVYGRPDYLEGLYEGVGYWDAKRLPADAACDVFVSWRQPEAWRVPVNARTRVCWMHDLNAGPSAGEHLAKYDRVLGVSLWHQQYLETVYNLTNVSFVPNGINLALFDPTIAKVPFKCVWSSSPDRDLELLLALWPRLTATEPEATLEVAYGWQGIDARINAGDQGAAAFKDRLSRKMDALSGVTWHGRLGQDALARLKSESWLAPYPTSFLEVSCISMLEAMAAGCVPVTLAVGALPETIGEAGYVIPGAPHSKVTHDFFIRVCQAVLGEANARVSRAVAGRERAKLFTWAASLDRWQGIVAELLEPGAVQVDNRIGVTS